MADNQKFVSRFLLIGLAVVILIILVTQYNAKQKATPSQPSIQRESYQEPEGMYSTQNSVLPLTKSGGDKKNSTTAPSSVLPSESQSNEDYKAIDFNTENKLPSDCFPRDRLTAEDLLPKDAANSKWAQVNPAGQGDAKDQNYLTAAAHMGINTVGQTLRNPNYQLRSEPPNPRFNVGPWNQTTIEYDQARRYFEIGEC